MIYINYCLVKFGINSSNIDGKQLSIKRSLKNPKLNLRRVYSYMQKLIAYARLCSSRSEILRYDGDRPSPVSSLKNYVSNNSMMFAHCTTVFIPPSYSQTAHLLASKYRLVDSLLYLVDDYRRWLDREESLLAADGLRIALISRLFSNLSNFSLHHFNQSGSSPLFEKMAILSDSDVHLPHHC